MTLADSVDWLRARLDFVSDFPVMEAAMAGAPPTDVATEVRAVFLELYDVLARVGDLVVVVESSGSDLRELAEFFLDLRRETFSRMARYVQSRIDADAFRPLEDPAVTARLLLELVNWSAVRHPRRGDPESLPAEAARNAVADIAVNALVGT